MISSTRTMWQVGAVVGLALWGGAVDPPHGEATIGSTTPLASGWSPLPADTPFDYQLGGAYTPPAGVAVVVRDWFSGTALVDGYSICYVNAFQTQPDEVGVDRADERSNWPADLVLTELGDDPNWGGEYLVDLATSGSRHAAADWVQPMIQTCHDKGFDAVEFDNLDSWARFDDTPIAERVPFGPAESAAYATELTDAAHELGLAVAQKNTLELGAAAVAEIGFDFLVIEECGRFGECEDAAELYGDRVLAVEYDREPFDVACDAIGDSSSVVLRDIAVSPPESATYVYDEC